MSEPNGGGPTEPKGGGETEGDLRSRLRKVQAALSQLEREGLLYRDLFDHGPIPCLITDHVGTIIRANQGAARLLGVDRDNLQARPLSLFLGDEAALRDHLAALERGEDLSGWETEAGVQPDRRVQVEVSARVAEPGAHNLRIHWVMEDTTRRQTARRQARELHREQAARAALEQVALRARFLSEAGARLMGVHDPQEVWRVAADLAGQHAVATLAVEVDDDRSVRIAAVAGDGGVYALPEDPRGTTLDLDEAAFGAIPLGAIRRALATAEPEVVPAAGDSPDAAGACVVVPIGTPDRTLGALAVWLEPGARIGEELLVARQLADRAGIALESARLFQELIRARVEAEEASVAEADFLSIVSHELRTPLTAMVSYAELLQERAKDLPERVARYARQIASAADHQRQLVEQILSYRRIQRGEEQGRPEPLDFRKAARSAMSMVRPQVGDRPLRMDLVLPEEPVRGVFDNGRLQQILTNLLSNAVRHTSDGWVRLSLETEGSWVVFRVEDTGEGIEAEDLPRIFDRFWRREGSVRDRGGSGLGLTITRELVARVGGRIEVHSERGIGTVFTVRVPRSVEVAGPARVGYGRS